MWEDNVAQESKKCWVLAQRGCGTRARKHLRIYRSNRAQLHYTIKASMPLKTDYSTEKVRLVLFN